MNEDDPIEVGEIEADGLRLWRSKEAMRQGEMRLSAQTANRAALETRATSILSWSVAAIVAITIGGAEGQLVKQAIWTAIPLALCALLCVSALWPRAWLQAGHTSEQIDALPEKSELYLREAIAEGYQVSIERNVSALEDIGSKLKWAWLCFFVTAPVAIIAMFIQR